MRKFGPKAADHPTIGTPCAVCRVQFIAGDMTTTEMMHAVSAEEARKARQGQVFIASTVEVHWECRSGRRDSFSDPDLLSSQLPVKGYRSRPK